MTEDSLFDAADTDKHGIFPADLFPLYREEFDTVEGCKKFARSLLKRADLTPEQIVAVGYLLHALCRLPLPTKGIFLVVGLKISGPDGDMTQTIHLSSSVLRFDEAGYEKGDFGSDSYGRAILDIEVGWRNEDYEPEEAYAWITSLCAEAGREGYTVEVENSSDEMPDWDKGEATHKDWNRLPALYG